MCAVAVAWVSGAIAMSDPGQDFPRALIDPPAVAPAVPANAGPADVQFDPSLMLLPGIDLGRYSRSGYFPPGVYRVDIVVNGRLVGREEIRFINPGGGRPKPCLDDAQLQRFGINRDRVPAVDRALPPLANGESVAHPAEAPLPPEARADLLRCGDVFSSIRYADAWLNHASLSLRLTVPQAAIALSDPVQNVPLGLLADGVTAGILGYNFSEYSSTAGSSEFLQLNGRLNTGLYRTYWGGSLNHANDSGWHWSNSNLYTDRPVNELGARMSMGEIQSSGEVLSSVPLVGARLYSEQGALSPYTGSKSLVQGVARSQAHVILRQQGAIVFETNVPPGPFSLDDFQAPAPVDINVEVQESDGTVETFVVPYIRPAALLNPGQVRFDAAVGVTHFTGLGNARNPAEAQGLMYYGLRPAVTVFGGWQFAFGGSLPGLYSAEDIGATLATRYGSLTGDLSASHADLARGRSLDDLSMRLSYQYGFQSTGTQLGLAAYRFSGPGYLTLPQAVALGATSLGEGSSTPFGFAEASERQRFDLMATQPLGKGTLSARLMLAQYWPNPQLPPQGPADGSTFLLGYSRRFGDADFTYSLERDTGSTGVIHRQLLQLSIPLGAREAGALRPILNNTVNSQNGVVSVSQSSSLTRRFDGQPVTLGVQYGYNPAHLAQGNLTMSMGTVFNALALNAGVGVGPTGNTYSLVGMGALLAHPGGVELLNNAPDTIALVHVDGGAGARVVGGNRIDDRGYGVTFLSPLKDNVVEVNPSGASTDLELQTTRKHAAPSRGAVVELDFATVPGRSVHIDARSADGKPLPFGATVTDGKGAQVGLVGQGGGIFARVPAAQGQLRVVWGDNDDVVCNLNYHFSPEELGKATSAGLPTTEAACAASKSLAAHPAPGPSVSQSGSGAPLH